MKKFSIKKAFAAIITAAALAAPITAYADGESFIHLCDAEAEAGEPVAVKIELKGNETGVSQFRLRVKCDGLEPDKDQPIGGEITKKGDDVLCSYGDDSVLIVWGSGLGNEKLTDDLSEGGVYNFNKDTDEFFTVYFTVPEDAKEGDTYNVQFEDVSLEAPDGSAAVFDAKSGTIKVTKEAPKALLDLSDDEKNADKKTDTVPMNVFKFLGGMSLFLVAALAVLVFLIDGQKKKMYEKLEELFRIAQSR